MGMYDSVFHPCPWCGAENEAQSKSGECIMSKYDFRHAPLEVLWGLEDNGTCEKCDKEYYFDFDICPACHGSGSFNVAIHKVDRDEHD